jgi:hypothetical protein
MKREAMSEDKESEPQTQSSSKSLSTDELPEQTGQEVQVHYQPTPPRSRADHEIHPRVPIPPVPEGEEVPDDSPSPPVDLD